MYSLSLCSISRTEDFRQANNNKAIEWRNHYEKRLMIEGMMCQNCVKHVTHALEGISGASHVQVSLENKKATVEVPESVTDETLKAAVTEAGYKVTEIIPHEG